MLKRSNTSPMLPSHETVGQSGFGHHQAGVRNEHRKNDVHSMVVSKSKALDAKDSLEPTYLQMTSAIDALAPPPMESAESLLAPPPASETALNDDEKSHDVVPSKDVPFA